LARRRQCWPEKVPVLIAARPAGLG